MLRKYEFEYFIIKKGMNLGKTTKVAIGWVLCTVGGIYSFYLAKRSIEQQRYENMKARQRMKASNVGQYEPSSRKFTSQYEPSQ
ncbi:uncharacterized protein [Euwallacea fornicatus]|uniref:uncharacterized protein n=1 Tax=Euwallacea fornicatus TaxID=995702 RepID=UPI00338E58E3